MFKRWAYTLLPVYLLLSAPVGPVQKARIEVISSVEELTEAFDASASSHDGVLVFILRPSVRWPSFGKFLAYTLRVLPEPVSVENVALKHQRQKLEWVVRRDESRTGRFEIDEKIVPNAYVTGHFQGGKIQGSDVVNVLIPLSLVQTLAAKKPNQSLEPTTTSVTPAAVVAHL